MPSRIIKHDQAAELDRWLSPAVEDSAASELEGATQAGAHLLTVRQMEALQSGAEREAAERGYREGFERGRAEHAALVERLEHLLDALARPFEELDVEIEEEVVTLARTLARHILRRELKTDSGYIIGAVRDCMRTLPAAARDICVYLNPKDAAVVREHAGASEHAPRWRIEEDASLDSGDLRVSCENSEIDGRLESRLNEICAVALDTGRSRDGEP